MSEESKAQEHYQETERKVIYLMLKYRNAIDEVMKDISPESFDKDHQFIVRTIFKEHENSNHLRRLSYETHRQYVIDEGNLSELPKYQTIYDKCITARAERDDLGMLKGKLVEGYLGRKSHECLHEFRKESQNKGYQYAIQSMIDRLQSMANLTEPSETTFASLPELREPYIKTVEDRRNNPETIIKCGIEEIDEAVGVGFKPQHLTLIVAAPGGHKTNLMLNMALNIADVGHGVLFIPLEMPWQDVTDRIVCNRAGIDGSSLANPRLLSDEDMKKIREASIWLERNKNFYFLDASQRPDPASLRREIKKRIQIFQPKVVVIDYADNLGSNKRFESKTIEIGEMLKSLRFMGKEYGFHIITAAQMNRAAIKALREGNDEALDSTAIHGSHSYGSESDTIIGLVSVLGERTRIKTFTIKSRHAVAGMTGELSIRPERFQIFSMKQRDSLRITQTDDEMEAIINTPRSTIETSLEEMPDIGFVGDLDFGTEDELSKLGT